MSDEEALRELRTISKILLFANSAAVEKELEKVAPTEERKKVWVLIYGKRMPKDIATDGKVGERTVNYFLIDASAADIVEYTKGKPPRRSLNYVPPAWIELVKLPESNEGESAGPTQTTMDHQEEQASRESK
jgi:hypothetical protein